MDLTDATDGDLRESMGAFEAALAAREPAIVESPLTRILLAMDGSNQDDLAASLALGVARNDDDQIGVLYAYEGPEDKRREAALSDNIELWSKGETPVLRMARPNGGAGKSYEQILQVAQAEQSELIVCVAPYLDDFDKLGTASVGTNLDMLMAKAKVPVLVARDPTVVATDVLGHVIVPVTPWLDQLVDGAAWALRMVEPGGELHLLAVLDEDRLRQAGFEEPFTVDEADEEMLAGLHKPEVAGLIAVLQRLANERGLNCRVSIRSGELPEAMIRFAKEQPALTVAATPRDPKSPVYQRVQALVRASRYPVLVV